MSAPEKDTANDAEGEGEDTNYVAPKKVDLAELVNQDAEDESLRKYKEALLGAAATGNVVSPTDDPRRVVIEKMRVIFEDRPGGDIEYDLSTQAKVEEMKDNPFIIKEGAKYKIEVTFRVQHDIVSGLKYQNKVYLTKMSIKAVDSSTQMLGSFGPQADPHVVVFPRYGWDEAPTGMSARQKFKAKSTFTDDDGQKHLEYEYRFQIKKDWS